MPVRAPSDQVCFLDFWDSCGVESTGRRGRTTCPWSWVMFSLHPPASMASRWFGDLSAGHSPGVSFLLNRGISSALAAAEGDRLASTLAHGSCKANRGSTLLRRSSMDVVVRRGDIAQRPAGAVAIGVFQGERALSGAAAAVDRASRGALTALVRSRDFSGRFLETAVIYP